jgi:hypothetical protein
MRPKAPWGIAGVAVALLALESPPPLLLTDHQTGRSIRLEGAADAAMLLSALDWLASAP